MKTIVSERQGEKGRLHQYVRIAGGELQLKACIRYIKNSFGFCLTDRRTVHVVVDSGSHAVPFRGVKNILREVFLPQGYPSSVSADYLEYQIWDTVQVFICL